MYVKGLWHVATISYRRVRMRNFDRSVKFHQQAFGKNDMVLVAKERQLADNSPNRTRLRRILFAGQIRKDLAGKYSDRSGRIWPGSTVRLPVPGFVQCRVT